jgi:hypothetical protein
MAGVVYLSVTGDDLSAHRRALAQAARACNAVALESDHTPHQVDDLAQADLFVALIGDQRGEPAPVTEALYDKAGALGIPRRVYLSATPDAESDFAAFRARIRSEGTPEQFTTPASAAALLEADLRPFVGTSRQRDWLTWLVVLALVLVFGVMIAVLVSFSAAERERLLHRAGIIGPSPTPTSQQPVGALPQRGDDLPVRLAEGVRVQVIERHPGEVFHLSRPRLPTDMDHIKDMQRDAKVRIGVFDDRQQLADLDLDAEFFG